MAISHAMRKYHESESILEKLNSGTLDKEGLERFDRYVSMASLQARLLAVEISAQKLAAIGTNAAKTVKNLRNSGFISTASIPVVRAVDEVFPCPEQGDCNISREECLDYSGDSRHIGACQKCEHFTTTRKQVCP